MARSEHTEKKKTAKKPKKKKDLRVSFHKQPEAMQLEMWQMNLRRQFGEEQDFQVTNTGAEPFFSEYQVWNPSSRNAYQVEIRAALPKNGLVPSNTLFSVGNTCNCQDFKTNRLGLCKHISATLHKINKQWGAKKAFKAGFRPEISCVYVDYRQEPKIRLYIGTAQEAAFRQWAMAWFDEQGFLQTPGFVQFETLIAAARAIQPEFQCASDAFDLIVEHRERLNREARIDQLLPAGAHSAYFDNLLKTTLFPYQKTGIVFAIRAGRCLLADEMGLGKTIQAIGAAELLRREMGIQKVLIVCPTSLKYQWKSEIEKFTDATVLVVEGIQTKRIAQYEKSEAFFLIVSYNTMANDADLLHKMGADLLILDEAQRIKNFRTKVSIQVKRIQTPYCFILTGTPLENKLEDLYAVVQLIDQHKLPPLYRFLDRYQIKGDNGQIVGYKNLKEIGVLLADCLIRRLKKEVLRELPKRMDKVLMVPMMQQQVDIHRDLADAVARLVAKWRKYHFLSEKDRRILILCLSQMRMVADSTYILDQQTRFDTKIDELLCIFEEALVNDDQKIVVFSQWERMTRLVAQELDAVEVGYAYLHGGIASADREDLITRFREDPDCRVFLSTDAGGVGLNLQSASLMVNLDIPWNPAVLEQRIGRIYRLGQAENVTIINMVSASSIEERMLDILVFKSSLAQGILDPEGDDTIFMSESKFKKFMENVENLAGNGWDASDADVAAETDELERPDHAAEPELNVAIIVDNDLDAFTPSVKEDKAETTSRNPTSIERGPKPTAEEEKKADVAKRTPSSPSTPQQASVPESSQELIRSGVNFFSGLAQTLSSPEKTQELVQSIVQTDAETGQTYLKIPVENAAVVENAVKLLGGLLAGLGR